MERPVNRITPGLPVTSMQTYAIRAPLETHFRKATCREVDCPHYLKGWKTVADESTDLGQRQAAYIRHTAGRHFTEERNVEGVTTFVFPAGQTCFRSGDHQVRLDRPEIFLKVGGDWRGFTTPPQVMRADDWQEDFEEHQAEIADAIEGG